MRKFKCGISLAYMWRECGRYVIGAFVGGICVGGIDLA